MSNLNNDKLIADNQLVWKGFVCFLPFASGSKSESLAPYLICDPNSLFRLYSLGDNPFEHETIRPLHRCYCEVRGKLDEKKGLIHVSNIFEVEDPLLSTSE